MYYIGLGRTIKSDRQSPPRQGTWRWPRHHGSDYLRYRGTFFWASGDKNPEDGRATGFDAILDDPNIIGGQFSFWNRVGIPLTGAGVGLVQPNSVLPSLRSSKTQGQANHVNPGIFIYNAGLARGDATHQGDRQLNTCNSSPESLNV